MNGPLLGTQCLLRISRDRSTPAFHLLEGLRLTGWTVKQAEIDVTTLADDGWRRLLPGGGSRAFELCASGLYLGSIGEVQLRQAAMEGEAIVCELSLDEGILGGRFVISELRFETLVSEETTYHVTLRSAGPISLG